MTFRNGVNYNMSQREKFELIDSEVKSFYEYCKQAGFSDEEMDIICRPLTSAVRKASIKKWIRLAFISIFAIIVAYNVCQTDTFQWHASAVGRILMIKFLPFWDWRPLFYQRCIIEKPQNQAVEQNHLSLSDCAACEAIGYIARISDTDYHSILNQHLIRGAPVIITDAYHEWSSSKNREINLTNLLNDDERLRDSVPCRIQTNIRTGRQPADLQDIFSRITNTKIPNWFVHFQNCDLQAVKSLRVLAPRPYFLSPHVPPSHFNWLLISNHYMAPRYKYLELDIGLIIMSQLKGVTSVQLKPRTPCEEICTNLLFRLTEGETLVIANSLWEFEYLPDENGENIAIITETDWNEA